MRSGPALFLPAIFVLLATLCNPGPLGAQEVVWKDAMGRDVALRLPVATIVSLAPSVTEIIFAVGAGDSLAGVSKHCDYPVAAKLKPKAGDFNSPDPASIRAAAPDLVLFAEYARAEDIAALDEAGIKSFVLPAGRIEDIAAAVLRVGEMTGKEKTARTIADDITGELQELRRASEEVSDSGRPGVYVEVDGPAALYAVGPGSFMNDVIVLAGGRNVFADRNRPYFPVDGGEVIAADPDVILIDHPFQYKVGLSKRPGWARIRAVRSGRVYDSTDFDYILINRPGPRIIQSVREIRSLLPAGEAP